LPRSAAFEGRSRLKFPPPPAEETFVLANAFPHELVWPIRPRWPRRQALYTALLICVGAFAFSRFVLWPVVIAGDSMAPNYHDGQPNYINRLAYVNRAPARGDVVGVRLTDDGLSIKRIIGLPGDRIEFHRGTVVVNGAPLIEPYVERPLIWWLDPVTLGPEQYFVMGDNRTYSMLGAVSRDAILGKAFF
jgi:signal peptidase I